MFCGDMSEKKVFINEQLCHFRDAATWSTSDFVITSVLDSFHFKYKYIW